MGLWILQWVGLKLVSQVFAQGITISNPLAPGCSTVGGCLQRILNGLAFLAAPVVAIMILVGGFQIMASGGNEEKLKTGKSTILYAVIGYAIILLASGATALIQDILAGGAAGGGGGSGGSGGSGVTPPPTTPPPAGCNISCAPGTVCTPDPPRGYKCVPIPQSPVFCPRSCAPGTVCTPDPPRGYKCVPLFP